MRDDRAFREEEASVRLKHCDDVAGHVIRRKACRELRCVEEIVREPESLACLERAGNWAAVCETGVDAAADDQQLLTGVTLELPPERVGAAEQRDVTVMLPIRQPDDASEPVRGSAAMRNLELLEAEDARAASRDVVHGGAAHAAGADHDDVVHPG